MQEQTNKKRNTVLFIIGTTIMNIVVMALISMAIFVLLTVILPKNWDPSAVNYIYFLVFIIAFAAAYAINNQIVKIISRKIDMDKYFEPFLSKKR